MVVVTFSSTWAEKRKLSSSFGLSAKACLVSGHQSHHYSDPTLLVLGDWSLSPTPVSMAQREVVCQLRCQAGARR